MIASSPQQVKIISLPRRRTLTWEHLAYIALACISVFLHLYMLGSRALHHDETIHAFYSWLIYDGKGYLHDPLTHGPFLYYWTAVQYFLFGDSEFTARLAAAIFGVAITLLPWFFRRELGRGTALAIAVYLTISPVTLYVGRFIRHDVFALTQEIVCLLAILRYVATRHVRWIYIFFASFALMYTTIETSYLFTLTLGSFIILVGLWLVDKRLLLALGVYGVLAIGCMTILPDHQGLLVQGNGNPQPVLDANGKEQYFHLPLVTSQQALIVRNQGGDDLLLSKRSPDGAILQKGYLTKLNETLFGSDTDLYHTVKDRTLYGKNGVFLHQRIAALTIVSLLFLIGMIVLIWFVRGKDKLTMWQRALKRSQPSSFLHALHGLWSIHGVLALVLAFVIYALFFTSFGVYSSGVVSGVTGSLLYWVAQHDVERGNQPQHYYLVQLLVYEPLLLVAGFASAIAGIVHLALQIKRGMALTARRLAPGLLAWWALGSVALYSWAGEKMPWITLHIVVPLTFIAGWGILHIVRWTFKPIKRTLLNHAPSVNEERRGFMLYLLGFGIIAVYGMLQLARLIMIRPQAPTGSSATPWFILSIIGAWLLITLVYGIVHNPRRAIGSFVIALCLLWSISAFRSAWRLNYQNGDIPVEMMVYVQSSPDVKRIMDDLRRVSIAETGRMELPIMYDNEQILKWYVRDYNNARYFSGSMNTPPADDVAAILIWDPSNWAANEPLLTNFVVGQFPLRWWFPESEFYRFATVPQTDANGQVIIGADGKQATKPAPFGQDSTIGRLVRNPFDAATQNELWRYLLFRQPPSQLSSVDMRIYIRPKYAYMLGLQNSKQ